MTAPRVALLGVLLSAGASAMIAAPATARPAEPVLRPVARAELNIPKAACGVAGVVNKAIGIACGVLSNGGALIRGGKQLLHGNVGGAVGSLLGGGAGTVAATASTALGLAAIGTWVVGGAGAVLHETAAALGATTTPQLQSTWFSSTYWRMAAIAAMMTLPFLFAATVQAALRSDVALLAKAALGYLPLAVLSVAIAAPLTTLLLAASDELSGLISSAAGDAGPHLLGRITAAVISLTLLAKSPFLAFLIGLFMIGAAFALWIELLLREAAVYVVVLMLPLAFAALAWPARRIWAVRAVEILIALILSKFAIVAVLSLGGAAVNASIGHLGITSLMAGTVLIMLAALSPWALLRFVPLTEIATGAAGALRGELRSAGGRSANVAVGHATSGAEWVRDTTAQMQRDAALRMADAGDAPGPGSDGPGDLPRPGGDGAGGADLGGAGPSGPSGGTGPGREGADGATTVGGPAAPNTAPSATTVGGPAAPNTAPSATTVGGPAAPAAGDADAPPAREPRWSERSVLELGPNFGDTVVWPHEDAE